MKCLAKNLKVAYFIPLPIVIISLFLLTVSGDLPYLAGNPAGWARAGLTLKNAGFLEVFYRRNDFVLSNFLSNEDLSISYES